MTEVQSFGTLGGIPFRVDPQSVSWKSTPKTNITNTVGGRVVQVFGSVLSDLTVAGTFGAGGWQEQAQYLKQVQAWADSHVGTVTNQGGQGLYNGPPIRFTYSPLGWDMSVYLLSFVQPDSSRGSSIDLKNETFAPNWMLKFFIYQDNGSLTKAVEASVIQYINNLSAAFGYFPGSFAGNTAGTSYPHLIQTPGA